MNIVRLYILLILSIVCLFVITPVIAESDLEEFMMNFEPNYHIEGYTNFGGMNTESPYAKPVRRMVTTAKGTVLMLDKVLVTEDNLTVSVLIGFNPDVYALRKPDYVFLGLSAVEVSPKIPYPKDYFEPPMGGGGGGGSDYILNVVNGDPFVVYDAVSTELMFYDGYVSPRDQIEVKVKILEYNVCWNEEDSEDFDPHCYEERGPWEFKFETDGSELAEKTKEIELKTKFEIMGKSFELNWLLFNPMYLILFTNDWNSDHDPMEGSLFAFVTTDDGVEFRMDNKFFPYTGYSELIVDQGRIRSLEETRSLKVSICHFSPNPHIVSVNMDDKNSYTCNPAWSTVIDLE